MTIELSYAEARDIAAPIADVFAYRLDFMNLPVYNPNVTNIRRVDGGTRPGPGADYRFDLALPGWGEMEAFVTVLETDPPNRIVNDTGSTAMFGREVNTLTATNGATRLEIKFTIALPDEARDGLGFIEESGREQYRLELETMKKILEGG